MRMVFLDRDSLPVRFYPPKQHQSYQEYSQTQPHEVWERLKDADVAILNKVKLTREVLEKLPNLKLVSITATGFDCVDIKACQELKIAVTHVKDYAAVSVPEHVWLLILALRRNFVGYQSVMQQQRWPASSQFCVFEGSIHDIHGQTLGLLGMGSLAKAVAQIGITFGMKVIFHSPSQLGKHPDCVSLEELFAKSDVLSLHCPLNDATRQIINTKTLSRMKKNAILINTARGGLVDEIALRDALQSQTIAGAALDVLSQEPPPIDHPLLKLNLPNLIITPHVAWASQKTMEKLADEASLNIERWMNGEHHNRVV